MINGCDGKFVIIGSNVNVYFELFCLFYGSICNYNCMLKGSWMSGEKWNF